MNEYDIQMRECPDMEVFIEKIKDIGRYMGKGSNNLFSTIQRDIHDIADHIKY